MSVNVSVVRRKNPSKLDASYKYYAKAQAAGEMNFDELSEDISTRCTVTQADVSAVLYSVVTSMKAGLGRGAIVRLGNFGSFQIEVSSDGVEDKKDFSLSQIREAKIAFRPGKALVALTRSLTYNRVPQLKEVEQMEEGTGSVCTPEEPEA